MKDNRTYYDDFADWYENERHHGYHALIDRLQFGLLEPHCPGADVLEVGCGTGLILQRVAPIARRAVGLDISPRMLERARQRGLDTVEGTATELPFEDGSFDLVYSFKVLAHVEEIQVALGEIARVLRPGGLGLLDFYNRHSLRYLIKSIKRPNAVSEETTDHDVFTRYDSLRTVRSYLPPNLNYQGVHGIRTITPVAQVHDLPLIGRVCGYVERAVRDAPGLSRLGGFMVVRVQRA
ncbi:MAG: class I SAM-dependent methyltransferase [Myxococcota bacterium]|nr:class I SAM-dependent methyltransferase [Myxococcota bacterium]